MEPRTISIPARETEPFFFILPHEPGNQNAPARSFRVVNELAQLDSVYEGRGLTLERVIAAVSDYFGMGPEDEGGLAATKTYDLVVFEDGIVAAVIRNFGDGKGTFRVMELGHSWISAMGEEIPGEGEDIPDDEDEEEDEPEAEPTPAAEPDDRDDSGIAAHHEIRAAASERRGVAWLVTEGDQMGAYSHSRKTLDEVIAEVTEDVTSPEDFDQAIWKGERLMAVVRSTPDGPVVVRF